MPSVFYLLPTQLITPLGLGCGSEFPREDDGHDIFLPPGRTAQEAGPRAETLAEPAQGPEPGLPKAGRLSRKVWGLQSFITAFISLVLKQH